MICPVLKFCEYWPKVCFVRTQINLNLTGVSFQVLDFDRASWKVRARGWGESFDLAKHPQGTEVKAITYSNMQIHEKEDRTDLYVIIDI